LFLTWTARKSRVYLSGAGNLQPTAPMPEVLMALRLVALVAAVILACALFAATPEDVFHAIRQNDLAQLKAMASGESVKMVDSRGTTPLHYAATVGSVEALQML